MPLVKFDEKLITWVNFFDTNNKLLIDWLNLLDEKFRNPSLPQSTLELCKKFYNLYIKTYQINEEKLASCNYNNIDYTKLLKKIHIQSLGKAFIHIGSWKNLTKANIETIKEAVMNKISFDKQAAKFLIKKYKDDVDKILNR